MKEDIVCPRPSMQKLIAVASLSAVYFVDSTLLPAWQKPSIAVSLNQQLLNPIIQSGKKLMERDSLY